MGVEFSFRQQNKWLRGCVKDMWQGLIPSPVTSSLLSGPPELCRQDPVKYWEWQKVSAPSFSLLSLLGAHWVMDIVLWVLKSCSL